MIICFELSMPRNNAWNGKWTGDKEYYAIVHNFGRSRFQNDKAAQILRHGYFTYDFGDGWAAGIRAYEVDAQNARTIRSKSKGFCGYDWMVKSIIENLKIEWREQYAS